MGHRAAGWLNRPERIQEEMPDDVVENMRLEPNHVVADIGAGSGYFSFRIASRVPSGKVFAVDIQPEMLQLIEGQKRELNVDNVESVLGTIDDPNIEPDSIDAAIMVDAYHEFSHPFEMIDGIYNALRPGGRIFLLEYRGEDASVPIRPLHKMTQEQVHNKQMFGLGMNIYKWKYEDCFAPYNFGYNAEAKKDYVLPYLSNDDPYEVTHDEVLKANWKIQKILFTIERFRYNKRIRR